MAAAYFIAILVCTFIYLGLLEMTNKVEYESRYKEDKETSWKITKWYAIALAVITLYCMCVR